MIPRNVYSRPRLGSFVFHDSLLPNYRGFSPTVWALINGEKQTGVSLFAISEGVDAGDIVDQRAVPIGPDSTIAEVMQQVTQTYIEMLETNIQPLIAGTAPRHPQDHSRATFTCKRTPQDNEIDWTLSTDTIYNLIRASGAPYPGAYTYLNGKKLMVWSAARLDSPQRYLGSIPGRVVEVRPWSGSVVLTGDGSLLLRQCQLEGTDIVCAADVLKRLSDTLGRK
jgi:methionyl-tRNA formyltransferase